MKSVAVFGLSADPPTGRGGHLGILLHLIKTNLFDEIWIVPVYTHAFANKKNLQPFEHRVMMCKLNFERYSTTKTPVVVKELERIVCEAQSSSSGRVGTIDLIRHIKATEPDIRLHLVLGADTFSDLTQGKWKESETVMREASIEVFDRRGVASFGEASYHGAPAGSIRFHKEADLDHVSSTAIRAALAASPPDPSSVLNAEALGLEPAVLDYIISNRLYSAAVVTEDASMTSHKSLPNSNS